MFVFLVSDEDYSRNTVCTKYDIINILPLVEGVIVDYHTREKISHSGKRISPSTKGSMFFFYYTECQ